MIINLKYGYDGRTINTLISPTTEPDMVANTMLKRDEPLFYPKFIIEH